MNSLPREWSGCGPSVTDLNSDDWRLVVDLLCQSAMGFHIKEHGNARNWRFSSPLPSLLFTSEIPLSGLVKSHLLKDQQPAIPKDRRALLKIDQKGGIDCGQGVATETGNQTQDSPRGLA